MDNLRLRSGGESLRFDSFFGEGKTTSTSSTSNLDIIRNYSACFGEDSIGSASSRHLPIIVANLHRLGILSSSNPIEALVKLARFRQAIGFDLQQETEAFQELNEFERAVVSTLISHEAFDLVLRLKLNDR